MTTEALRALQELSRLHDQELASLGGRTIDPAPPNYTEWRSAWANARAALAHPPREPAAPMPKNADHATAMLRLSAMWLMHNAPDTYRLLMGAALAHPPEGAQPEPVGEVVGTHRVGFAELATVMWSAGMPPKGTKLYAGAQTLPAAPTNVYDAEAFWLLSHAITRESWELVHEWTRRRDAWLAKSQGFATPGVPSDLGAESKNTLVDPAQALRTGAAGATSETER